MKCLRRTTTLFLLLTCTLHETLALPLSYLGSDADFEASSAPSHEVQALAASAARVRSLLNHMHNLTPPQAYSPTSRAAHAPVAPAASPAFVLNQRSFTPLEADSPTHAAQGLAASASSAVSLLKHGPHMPILTQLQASTVPAADKSAESDLHLNDHLRTRIAQMRTEIDQTRREEEKMFAENSKLQQQIALWHKIGARVEERNAKAMEVLRQVLQVKDGLQDIIKSEALPSLKAGAAVEVESSHTPTLRVLSHLSGFGYGSDIQTSNGIGNDRGLPGTSMQNSTRNGTKAVLMQISSASFSLGLLASPWLWHSLIFVFITFVFFLGYMSQSVVSKYLAHRAATHTAEGQDSSCMGPSKLGWRQSILRAFSFGRRYKIEFSEIHISSLCARGDVFISLKSSSGKEQRTKVMRSTDGAFLKFNEIFTFDVQTSDGPFILSVNDLGNRLAYYHMPAKELINLANREHREYFRCELTADQALSASNHGKKPYAAMRIRMSAQS